MDFICNVPVRICVQVPALFSLWQCDMVGQVRRCFCCILLYECVSLSLPGSILCSEYKSCTLRIRSVSLLDWLMNTGRWDSLKSSPGNQDVSVFSLLIFCFTCMNHLRTQKHICRIYFQPHKATWYISVNICQPKRRWLEKNYRPIPAESKLWQLCSHSFMPSPDLTLFLTTEY